MTPKHVTPLATRGRLGHDIWDSRESNASLIAAATELLECLKLAMADIGVDDGCASKCESPWHGRALAAVAKAEGK
jgi:hypothetical protein